MQPSIQLSSVSGTDSKPDHFTADLISQFFGCLVATVFDFLKQKLPHQ